VSDSPAVYEALNPPGFFSVVPRHLYASLPSCQILLSIQAIIRHQAVRTTASTSLHLVS
jgi:hypothetical protein